MRVSFNMPYEKVRDQNGFGYASKMCKESLAALGHEVNWRDATADVEINFIQPDHWHWTGPYRIGYLPWESTKLRDHWRPLMNEVDEIWTPSPVVAQWMMDDGINKDVRVYQHGVEKAWTFVDRGTPEIFRVLHHGAEALRKGGNETIQAFLNTLYDENAELTLKMVLDSFAVHDTKHIRIRKTKVPLEELIALYHECNLLAYPSAGEGFGLAPLQAMATGMSVLITRGWAPYEYLLSDEMLIDSKLVDSPWPEYHPGQVFEPDQQDLRDKMRFIFDNYERFQKEAVDISARVRQDYDWVKLTEQAFAHLI